MTITQDLTLTAPALTAAPMWLALFGSCGWCSTQGCGFRGPDDVAELLALLDSEAPGPWSWLPGDGWVCC